MIFSFLHKSYTSGTTCDMTWTNESTEHLVTLWSQFNRRVSWKVLYTPTCVDSLIQCKPEKSTTGPKKCDLSRVIRNSRKHTDETFTKYLTWSTPRWKQTIVKKVIWLSSLTKEKSNIHRMTPKVKAQREHVLVQNSLKTDDRNVIWSFSIQLEIPLLNCEGLKQKTPWDLHNEHQVLCARISSKTRKLTRSTWWWCCG